MTLRGRHTYSLVMEPQGARWRGGAPFTSSTSSARSFGKETPNSAAIQGLAPDRGETVNPRHPPSIEAMGATIEASELVDFLEADQAELKSRYGGSYEIEFGWADAPLREKGIETNGRPKLRHLEQAVGGLESRPWYRMASHAGHAVLFAGAFTPDRGALVPGRFGPKPVGLHDPARLVCLDLWMTAGNFLSLYYDEEFAWAHAVLGYVRVEASRALFQAEGRAREHWLSG